MIASIKKRVASVWDPDAKVRRELINPSGGLGHFRGLLFMTLPFQQQKNGANQLDVQ